MGVKVDKRDVSARIYDSLGNVSVQSALEKAGYIFPQTTQTLKEIMEALQYDPEEAIAKMDAIVSQMAELERMVEGWVEEENDQSTSTENSLGNASIFGTYSCSFLYNSSEDLEEDNQTIILRDNGAGIVGWIDEDGDETILSYDEDTSTIYYETEALTIHIDFSQSGGTVIGTGYMKGIFWKNPIDVSISLTKISD
jgi:hypothetical protein